MNLVTGSFLKSVSLLEVSHSLFATYKLKWLVFDVCKICSFFLLDRPKKASEFPPLSSLLAVRATS